MSNPDDIVRGCTKYLLTLPDVVDLVGSDADGAWIFEGEIGVNLQGTSKQAIVVRHAGSWGVPSPGNTTEYPRIAIEIHSDPPRDASLNVTKPQEARTAADWLYKNVDRHMNRTDRAPVWFGTMVTFDCTRLGDISYLPVMPADDHYMKGTVYYGVETATFFTS